MVDVNREVAREKHGPGKIFQEGMGWAANLPTCFWKSRNLHPEHGAAWARSSGAVRGTRKILLAPRATSKLHSQSLAFEITPVCRNFSEQSMAGIPSKYHIRKAR